jgi:hypothetical protein
MGCLQKFGWEVLHHTPYSLVPAPSDYHLLGQLKEKSLAGHQFNSDFEVMEETKGTQFF